MMQPKLTVATTSQPIAKIADVTSYSMENSKHITTGDGGIVVTNRSELAEKMRKFVV